MHTIPRRGVVAVVTAVACVVMMASPASAAPHDVVITGGEMVFDSTGTPTGSMPFGGTAGTGCGATIVFDQDTSTDVADITTFTTTNRIDWLSTTNAPYVTEITRVGSTPGTSSSGVMTPLSVTLRMDIYAPTNANPATDCAHGATRVCRYVMTFNVAAAFSSTTGDLQASSDGHFTMAGATVVAMPPCTSSFNAFTGGSANFVSSTFHVTT